MGQQPLGLSPPSTRHISQCTGATQDPLKSPFKDFTESVTPATAPGPFQHQAQVRGPTNVSE